MIELTSLYGVKAHGQRKCEIGVWVRERKIGAIGARILYGITFRGLAFNIDPDLSYYKHIVPRGIADKEVTSLRRETDMVLLGDDLKVVGAYTNKKVVQFNQDFSAKEDVRWYHV
ncbi:Octanoyltransferase [Cynara cardunculus var. scolymus]|uniref:Octanoyltransferase n=1 Tax=Cynara cardunculus var. scolymus TaxID=59895 RepID=A0A103YI02_CYNCS|nr:Octanoyltransferase [Cynara cardunculus var. scolymus]